jgi:hypothetical protein
MQLDARLSVDSLSQLSDMLLLGLALLARVDFPPILLASIQSLAEDARLVVKLVLTMTQTPTAASLGGLQNGLDFQLTATNALFLAGTGCFALPLIPNLAPQWRGGLSSFAMGPLWAVASQLLWLYLVLKRRLPEFRLQNLLPPSFLMFVNQFLKVSALTFSIAGGSQDGLRWFAQPAQWFLLTPGLDLFNPSIEHLGQLTHLLRLLRSTTAPHGLIVLFSYNLRPVAKDLIRQAPALRSALLDGNFDVLKVFARESWENSGAVDSVTPGLITPDVLELLSHHVAPQAWSPAPLQLVTYEAARGMQQVLAASTVPPTLSPADLAASGIIEQTRFAPVSDSEDLRLHFDLCGIPGAVLQIP